MKLRDILNEGEGLSDRVAKNMVDKANKYIAQAKKDEIWAVEPDSTWEEAYEFEPIKLSGKYITISYTEPYNKGKKHKERFKYDKDDWEHIDELKYMLRWVVRSVKKGYKSEGETPPKF